MKIGDLWTDLTSHFFLKTHLWSSSATLRTRRNVTSQTKLFVFQPWPRVLLQSRPRTIGGIRHVRYSTSPLEEIIPVSLVRNRGITYMVTDVDANKERGAAFVADFKYSRLWEKVRADFVLLTCQRSFFVCLICTFTLFRRLINNWAALTLTQSFVPITFFV